MSRAKIYHQIKNAELSSNSWKILNTKIKFLIRSLEVYDRTRSDKFDLPEISVEHTKIEDTNTPVNPLGHFDVLGGK